MMNALTCKVIGIGAWGPGFTHWNDLRQALVNAQPLDPNKIEKPKPGVIPANERRRAPLAVKLAVESSSQACEHAQISPKEVSCVFGSASGDTDITDYMCRTLASDNKQLSPTKFHNSVHNAAAGYWTISTDCMKSANSIAGHEHTASLALLEGMSQCVEQQEPVLITLFDAPVCPVLKPLFNNDIATAFSFILHPNYQENDLTISAAITSGSSDWPAMPNELLHTLFADNDIAKVIPLLTTFAQPDNQSTTLQLPLSTQTHLQLTINGSLS